MFCMLRKKRYPDYVSKYNSNCQKQIILLMIPNGERCHYLAVKKKKKKIRIIKRNNDLIIMKIMIFVMHLCLLKILQY